MADVVYDVIVQYSSVGSLNAPIGQINRAKSASDDWLKSMHTGARSVTASFNSAFDSVGSALVTSGATIGAAAGAALSAGIGKALHAGISFASVVESAQLGIATIKSTLGDMPFPKAFGEASKVTEDLRKAAARLPGEFKDALEMYQSIVPMGQQLGLSDQHMVKMSTRGVAMAAALGINQATFAHELSSALGGKVTSAMPLARKLGLHQSEWKKLKPEERVDYFDKLFAKADPAIEAYAHSWAGLTSSTKDNARNVAKSFAAPVFGSLKSELERGLDWFGSNEKAVHAWATKLGTHVDHAFHWGLDAIHRWYGPVTTFGRNLHASLSHAFGVAAPFLHRLEGVALGFLSDPKAVDKIAHVATTLLALRAGTGALGLGLDGAKGLGSLVSGLGGAGIEIGALGAAALPAAAALAALATGAYGIVDILSDPRNAYHAEAVESAGNIGKNLADAGKEIAKAAPAGAKIADAYGNFLLNGVEFWSGILNHAAHAVGGMADIANLVEATARKWGYLPEPAAPDPVPEINREPSYMGFPKRMGEASGDADFGIDKKDVPKHITNIHGGLNVKVEVQTNADPNRIASIVTDKIQKQLGRANSGNPMAAAYR